jgi:levanase/fructan beta-fructosidase
VFDGKTFISETAAIRAELGPNGYAAQTWSDIPAEDGRRLQIAWMANGKYPAMPFNQQLSFPVELSLRTTRKGIRLCREPVRELDLLHTREHVWHDHLLKSGLDRRGLFVRYGPNWRDAMQESHAHLIVDSTCELFDIRAEIELIDAKAFGAIIRGNDLRYDSVARSFTCLDHQIPVEPDDDGRLRLQILVDRTSLELFVGAGEVSASFCFLPGPRDAPLVFYALEGSVRLVSLTVYELASVWI